jgi:hypothetical protein
VSGRAAMACVFVLVDYDANSLTVRRWIRDGPTRSTQAYFFLF